MATARTYSPAQAAYLVARAALDVVRAEVKAASPACPPDNCDIETFDAWCDACAEIEIAHKLGSFEHALANAEQALVEWSSAAALAVATTESQRESVAICLDKGMRRLGPRAKLVELAMRLAA